MLEEIHDLAYLPPSDEQGLIAREACARVLVVGPGTVETAAYVEALAGAETRTITVPSAARTLHDGTYCVRDGSNGLALLVVRAARKPAAPSVGDSSYVRDHLGAAFDVYDDNWSRATPFFGSVAFAEGDLVEVAGRGGIGQVLGTSRKPGGNIVDVRIDGESRQYAERDLARLEGDPQSPEFWLSQPPASAEQIARTLTWIKLRHPLDDFLYSFSATRTVFKPYQFLPALKILSGSTGRILIADEVGLGKTIEAGLIWTELEQRAPIRRALIVVPSALQVKWQREMRNRFMRPVKILTKPDLQEFVRELAHGRDPGLIGIVSVESLRTYGNLLTELDQLRPRFDLVIVDEARSLRNRGTKTAQMGRVLAQQADHVVLLTATPLNLGSDDLFNLVNLLDPVAFPDSKIFAAQLEPNAALNQVVRDIERASARERPRIRTRLDAVGRMTHGRPVAQRTEFEQLRSIANAPDPWSTRDIVSARRLVAELNTMSAVLNRTRKVDVQQNKALRDVRNIEVQWSEPERELYDDIERYYRDRARRAGQPLGFVTQMPLRQATSCLPVARHRLLEHQEILGQDELESEYWSVNPADGDSGGAGAGSDSGPWEGSLPALSRDSKIEALRDELRALRASEHVRAAGVLPPVLIFTYFRGTVEYLQARLGTEFRVGKLHGGVPMSDREEVIQKFRDGQFDILIANQVGSEGLDFQFCNVLVNYDLPWNPMQVEQRIGRLDRIGQASEKILIFNMSIPGTIESDIIARLYKRIGVFEHSIGDLEPIIVQTMRNVETMLADDTLTTAERKKEIERQAQVIERNRTDAKAVEDQSGLLTSVGVLEVDGLTENGPASGKYVGAGELRAIVAYTVAHHGARMHGRRDGSAVIVGNAGLASAVNRAVGNSGAGSAFGSDLIRKLRDGEAIPVAFRPDEAEPTDLSSRHTDETMTDLISARHPLVRLAISELTDEPLARPQYGRVRIEGVPHILAVVTVLESRGLSLGRELWVTALDLATGERSQEAETSVLVALAAGTLQQPQDAPGTHAELQHRLPELYELEQHRVDKARHRKTVNNQALTDARIASFEHTMNLKISSAEGVLREGVDQHRDERVLRMSKGRIAALREQLARTRRELDAKRALVLSSQRVAILEVVP